MLYNIGMKSSSVLPYCVEEALVFEVTPTVLCSLSDEIIANVATFLDATDITQLSKCNRRTAVSCRQAFIWRAFVEKAELTTQTDSYTEYKRIMSSRHGGLEQAALWSQRVESKRLVSNDALCGR